MDPLTSNRSQQCHVCVQIKVGALCRFVRLLNTFKWLNMYQKFFKTNRTLDRCCGNYDPISICITFCTLQENLLFKGDCPGRTTS